MVILAGDIAYKMPPCEPASLHYQKNSSLESHNAVARPAHVAISHLKQASKRQGNFPTNVGKRLHIHTEYWVEFLATQEFHW